MNRIRLLALGAVLSFALAASAQQTATRPGSTNNRELGAPSAVPAVEPQLKVLTEKLQLTSDQQTKLKPILQELHDSTRKLVDDPSLSQDERLAKVAPRRYQAAAQIREILSDGQKEKFDQFLQGPHAEMHGNLSGTTSSPQAPRN